MTEKSQGSTAPRIAIKFGGATSSSSSKPANGMKKPGLPSSTLGKRPRHRALHGDSDSEDEPSYGKHETITTFGDDGGDNERSRGARLSGQDRSRNGERESQPLVIPVQRNAPVKDTEAADQDKPIKWGLSVTRKERRTADAPSQTGEPVNQGNGTKGDRNDDNDEDDKPVSADRAAIDALLGNEEKSVRKKLKIMAGTGDGGPSRVTEDDVLKRGMREGAAVSTEEEYNQIPEGEFGAALLRGMGWDGKPRGEIRDVKRRKDLIGLGAKEDEELKKAEEAAKHGHRERRPRLDDYRRDKAREREAREDRHSSSYKHERERERERERNRHSHSHRDGYRDRDRHREDDRRSRR